jgi:hypothetical protein
MEVPELEPATSVGGVNSIDAVCVPNGIQQQLGIVEKLAGNPANLRLAALNNLTSQTAQKLTG